MCNLCSVRDIHVIAVLIVLEERSVSKKIAVVSGNVFQRLGKTVMTNIN